MAESRITSIMVEVIGNYSTTDSTEFSTAGITVSGLSFSSGAFATAGISVSAFPFSVKDILNVSSANISLDAKSFESRDTYGITSRFNLNF